MIIERWVANMSFITNMDWFELIIRSMTSSILETTGDERLALPLSDMLPL